MTYLQDRNLIGLFLQDFYSPLRGFLQIPTDGIIVHYHPKGKMLATLAARSFSAAAPKRWNGLPVELHRATLLNSFKSLLKTLFYSHSNAFLFSLKHDCKALLISTLNTRYINW